MKFKNCEFLFTTNKLSGCNVYLIFGLNSDQENLKCSHFLNVVIFQLFNSLNNSETQFIQFDPTNFSILILNYLLEFSLTIDLNKFFRKWFGAYTFEIHLEIDFGTYTLEFNPSLLKLVQIFHMLQIVQPWILIGANDNFKTCIF